MYKGQKLGAVIPCYNEETQIARVIATMPAWVDRIYIVDDCSKDATVDTVLKICGTNPKVELLRHRTNQGVGQAIGTGYQKAIDEEMDIAVVMAGDGQMDPKDLPNLLDPIVEDKVDYCKGNRFFFAEGQGVKKIPKVRLVGNFILSALTKISSGYWHLSDSQCGYTAINLMAMRSFDVNSIYPSYGCPNDILMKLNVAQMRVGEVPVAPLYNVGEQSKMKIPKIIVPILRLLWRNFKERLFQKHVVRSGHPLVIAYAASAVFCWLTLLLGVYLVVMTLMNGVIPRTALIIAGFGFVTALQLLISALEMDHNESKDLQVVLPWRAHTKKKAEARASHQEHQEQLYS